MFNTIRYLLLPVLNASGPVFIWLAAALLIPFTLSVSKQDGAADSFLTCFLITLATGAGSSICSHVNDASFWMIKEFFGLTTKETLCTWTLMSTVVSILGLVFLLLVDMVL